MRVTKPRTEAGWRYMARIGALTATIVGCAVVTTPGCLNRPLERVEPRTTTTIVERLVQSKVNKIDLLLAIDNSRSMADKQEILKAAVPDLITSLVNPPCLDTDGNVVETPAGPLSDCTQGQREFEPVLDIHIGIISSSLGGHGADACEPDKDPNKDPTENDHGWLTHRDAQGTEIDTYQDSGGNNLGFLVWDGAAADTPPNPSHDPAGESNVTNLNTTFSNMVGGVGELGCGFEAILESWYRFLVDPEPYESIALDAPANGINAQAVVSHTLKTAGGPDNCSNWNITTDAKLLKQRTDFLLPDSLLAIIMLTDENDCSIRDGGIYWLASQMLNPPSGPAQLRLGAPTAECKNKSKGPYDSCCISCWQSGGGLDACKTNDPNECDPQQLTLDEDQINLRCWDQKRRFGIDFLQPIDRYTKGLTEPQVTNICGEVMDNPLFSDLDQTDEVTSIRDPSLVFIAGIVGVPWQDIARQDASGNPDLLTGLDSNGNAVGGFKSAKELAVALPNKTYNTWDLILGDPTKYYTNPADALPKDPLMIESVTPRTNKPHDLYDNAIGGVQTQPLIHPITGKPLIDPAQTAQTDGTSSYTWNDINGHEWLNPDGDDLQYACIFPLAGTRDCSTQPPPTACDCDNPGTPPSDLGDQNPLCQQQSDSEYGKLQYRAKAYPGIRELQVLKGVGEQGIVASICPAQQTQTADKDYGYRPAIGAIIERLKEALGGKCLPRSFSTESGEVPCLILEASKVADSEVASCMQCASNGHQPVAEDHQVAVEAAKQDSYNPGWNCICEIVQQTPETGLDG